MLVENVMQTGVITITPKTPLPEAMRLVRQRGVRHLPVVEDGTLVGIVSDRDLKRPDALTVDEIMTRGVITIGRMFPLEEAARLMVRNKVSALPVTEMGRLVGIVTETDVLELLVRAMGAAEPSSRLDVRLPERDGSIAEIVRAVEEARVGIASIMTLADRAGRRDVVVRVRSIDPRPAIARLTARGYAVRSPERG